MQEISQVIACDGCDAIYPKQLLKQGQVSKCVRCGTILERYLGNKHVRMVPYCLASIIFYLIANFFPIVEIELRGIQSRTTLFGTIIALYQENASLVALLVMLTTMLFPFIQLCVLLYLFLSLLKPKSKLPLGFNILIRSLQKLHPWGMLEVFLLGILIAIIKLTSFAKIIPGVALWTFILLTVLFVVVLSFNPKNFWTLAAQRNANGF